MARDAELKAKIVLDGASKVTSQLDDVADAADKAEEPIELTVQAKVDQALGALEELSDDAKRAATAAEALGQALGPELAGKANLDAMVAGFEKAGLSLEEVTANADQLGSKLREIAGEDGGGLDQIGARAKATGQDVENLGKSADSSKSVLANMVGNSVQDLGALGGVAGSAGVAIGQMGEYIADALADSDKLGNTLANFGKVAGPVALLSVATAAFAAVMDGIKFSETFRTENVKAMTEAIRAGESQLVAVNNQLRETGKLQADVAGGGFAGLGRQAKDVTEDLKALNLTVDDFNRLASTTDPAPLEAMRKEYGRLVNIGPQATDAQTELAQHMQYVIKAAEDQRDATKGANDELERTAEITKPSTQAVKDSVDAWKALKDPVSVMPDQYQRVADALAQGVTPAAEDVDAIMDKTGQTFNEVYDTASTLTKGIEDQTQAMADAKQAAETYQAVLASADWGQATLDAAVTGWQKLGEAQFGLTNIAAGVEGAYDALGQALKDNGLNFDVATEKGRANADVVQQLYQSLIPALSAAYADAGGSISSFRTNMEDLRSQTLAKLTEELGGNEEAAKAVLDQLGVFDGSTYESSFKVLGIEDANAKLALLSGVLGSLPPDVQRQVTLDVLAGDPQAALEHIQTAVTSGPQPTADLELNTKPAESDAQGFANADQPAATADLEANRKPADATADAFASEKRTTTPVTVDASTATAAAIILNFLSLARKANIYVDLPNVDNANHVLNLLTGARTAPIYATASTSSAERALNDVARDRDSTITARVVESDVARWYRINGRAG